jgi:hypothetical protein
MYGLALYSGGIQVGFSSRGRRKSLVAFLESQTLADSLIPSEQVDPQLNRPEASGSLRSRERHTARSQQNPTVSTEAEAVSKTDELPLEQMLELNLDEALGRSVIEPRHQDRFRVEERLQCATELVFDVAEEPEQLRFAAILARDEPLVMEDVNQDFEALCRLRHGLLGEQRRPVAEVASSILRAEVERRNSPMTIADQISLLRPFAEGQVELDDTDRAHVVQMLSLLEADEPLGSLDLPSMNSWVQGLVLFLLHSASPRQIVNTDREFFKVGTRAASIAAFLVGLRFSRDSYVSEAVFMPLRDHHIRKAIETLNNRTDETRKVRIAALDKKISFGSAEFWPAVSMLVFELGTTPLIADGGKSGVLRLNVSRIVRRLDSAPPKVTFRELEDWNQDEKKLTEILGSIRWKMYPRRKGGVISLHFSENSSDHESWFQRFNAVVLQFKGPVWLVSTDGKTHRLDNAKLFIKEDRLFTNFSLSLERETKELDQARERAGDEVRKKEELDRARKRARAEVRKKMKKAFRRQRERVDGVT